MLRGLLIGLVCGIILASFWFSPHASAQTNIVTLYGCTPATITARPCTLQAVSVTSAGVMQAVGQ